MRKPLFLISMALLVALIFIFACSDKSTQSNMNQGNAADPAFAPAKNDVASSVSEFSATAGEGGKWLNWNPGPFNVNVGDSVSYDSTSGWHVFARSLTNDNRQFAVVDSFRFTALDGMFQFRSDSTTNVFEQRLKKSSSLIPNSELPGVQRSKSFEINTRWVGLADSVTTLNGDFDRHSEGSNQVARGDSLENDGKGGGEDTVLSRDEDAADHFFGDEHNFFSDEEGFRQFTRDVQGQFNNVQFHTADLKSREHPRPFAGTLVEQISLNIVTPHQTITFSATVTVTFTPTGFHATMSGGKNSWEWDELFENFGSGH